MKIIFLVLVGSAFAAAKLVIDDEPFPFFPVVACSKGASCVLIDDCHGGNKTIVLRQHPCRTGGEYVCCSEETFDSNLEDSVAKDIRERDSSSSYGGTRQRRDKPAAQGFGFQQGATQGFGFQQGAAQGYGYQQPAAQGYGYQQQDQGYGYQQPQGYGYQEAQVYGYQQPAAQGYDNQQSAGGYGFQQVAQGYGSQQSGGGYGLQQAVQQPALGYNFQQPQQQRRVFQVVYQQQQQPQPNRFIAVQAQQHPAGGQAFVLNAQRFSVQNQQNQAQGGYQTTDRLCGVTGSWQAARDCCRSHGLNLAVIRSPQEEQALNSIMRGYEFWWIGGRRAGNAWVWDRDNSLITYFNWSHTGGAQRPQPDNREGNEFCLGVLNNFYGDGIRWHDIGCSHPKVGVCSH